MHLTFFSIPLHGGERADELNVFLAGHRIASVDRQLVSENGRACWAVCVEWTTSSGGGGGNSGSVVRSAGEGRKSDGVDWMKVLPPDEFAAYSHLRALRKELSEQTGVPLYGIVSNEQLAAMVRQRVMSRAALEAIQGLGKAKVERFGEAFLKVLKEVVPPLGAPRNAEETPDAPQPGSTV